MIYMLRNCASLKKAKNSCKELMNDKSKLEEAHATLSKDCELLTLSLETKVDELTSLKKSFENLKLTHYRDSWQGLFFSYYKC